jgi:ATP-binding cassette, subfamily B, bacterial
VSFGYRDDRRVLDDVSAVVRPGEMVAFIGPSGTGKSTLLNVLLRYYDPTDGAVLLDDVPAVAARLADWRAHFALVTQENLMLPTTVAENIGYGRPDASRLDIQRAAERAGAAEFIDALPERYDTVLAEGGANLSGGQRQRIAIARALVTEAPFLVLDEPTSALDTEHERRLIRTLHGLKRLRTVVLVTHRLESVVDCDQIFVMSHGRIVDRGTHAELVRRATFSADRVRAS